MNFFFKEKGWDVDYITIKENENNKKKSRPSNLLFEVPVVPYFSNRFLNKLFVLMITIFYGDIYGYSLYKKRREIFNLIDPRIDLCISFFTPRGMIGLGYTLKKKMKIPWLVDLQDSLDEGLNQNNLLIGLLWLKKKLKVADTIVHVSPEWAELDSKRIGKIISVFRHVIPNDDHKIQDGKIQFFNSNKISMVYAGNIHFGPMEVEIIKVVEEFDDVSFFFAGNENVSRELEKRGVSNKYVGYLEAAILASFYKQASIIVIFAWYTPNRKVIPSKFYEACTYNKPILIIGQDSGAFEILFEEWGHPFVVCNTSQKVKNAIEGYKIGDYSKFFLLEQCSNKVPTLSGFNQFLNSVIP